MILGAVEIYVEKYAELPDFTLTSQRKRETLPTQVTRECASLLSKILTRIVVDSRRGRVRKEYNSQADASNSYIRI